jgi:ARG and Rhodanese-Phosphatase-superfamily-associated Protein domain
MRLGRGWWGVLAGWLLLAPLAGQFDRVRTLRAQDSKGVEDFRESWVVLDPITRRNLSIYPVVSKIKAGSAGFLTLDEGIQAGVVRIAERGEIENAMYRQRDSTRRWEPERQQGSSASVNELVLLNRSDRPLILLAGEVVSGGKQNRIIGADMVVPPKSDPLPLSVFCVEHGRWTPGGGGFGTVGAIAHPDIRREAQMNKSQQGVWNSVSRSSEALAAPSQTSSYVDVLKSPQAKRQLDEWAASISDDYERELRSRLGGNAVGVVVAINGELVWSDVFPSAELFRKYWPKLLRSYVIEAESRGKGMKDAPPSKSARAFLLEDHGRAVIKEEPGAYRRTEISAGEYQIVALEALGKFADSSLLVHYNKMARD